MSDEPQTSLVHLGRIGRSRPFVAGTSVAVVMALGAGIAIGSLTWILLLPTVTFVAAVLIALQLAADRAHDDAWRAIAGELGMAFEGELELPKLTPMLGAGDRRRCPEWLTGSLPDGRPIGLGNYTFEKKRSDGQSTTWHASRFTLAVVGLSGAPVRGLHLRPRNALRVFGEPTLKRRGRTRIETESAAFNDRFDLYHDAGEDPIAVMRIISPTFIEALTGRELAFDLVDGTLAVFVEDHATHARDLQRVRQLAELVLARLDAVAQPAG